ncbi:MAG: outer membrane beta-barrel protein [Prevotella sp.]|nr:outer membrane beta-barrel protein [Prevotella sp.]
MKTLKIAFAAALISVANQVMAGGLLTNTNQNVAFLRNPARDAAIGIDGVYSNPAGVIFLGEGTYISLNLQSAKQTRTVLTGFPLFVNNVNHLGETTREFKGKADAPIIPSLQAAYNKGKWSLQFGFAITGGGGKCEFDNGLGSFEQVVAGVTTYKDAVNGLYGTLGALGIPGMANHAMGSKYNYDSYMRGRQYYYGFTLGAAYKLTDNLSVYGGLRMLYGTANYYGYVKNISVEHIKDGASSMVSATEHFGELTSQLLQYAGMMEGMGNAQAAEGLKQAAAQTRTLSVATQDIELNCDQTGWGVAPIIGVDYKTGRLNLAAKYEFKTRMRLKNKSANSASAKGISLLDKYADGNKVAEDTPALLTVGAQYELTPSLRVMAGWHHYFDADTEQFTKNMLGDSNEYLFGAEYDICKRVQVSAGMQRTAYDMKDKGMNDISFNVSSYSYGLGIGVQVSEKVKINAAWFQTLYDDYDMTSGTAPAVTTNSFTRSNRVIGLGVDLKL